MCFQWFCHVLSSKSRRRINALNWLSAPHKQSANSLASKGGEWKSLCSNGGSSSNDKFSHGVIFYQLRFYQANQPVSPVTQFSLVLPWSTRTPADSAPRRIDSLNEQWIFKVHLQDLENAKSSISQVLSNRGFRWVFGQISGMCLKGKTTESNKKQTEKQTSRPPMPRRQDPPKSFNSSSPCDATWKFYKLFTTSSGFPFRFCYMCNPPY